MGKCYFVRSISPICSVDWVVFQTRDGADDSATDVDSILDFYLWINYYASVLAFYYLFLSFRRVSVVCFIKEESKPYCVLVGIVRFVALGRHTSFSKCVRFQCNWE